MDRGSKVQRELDRFSDGVDALFIEYPAEELGPRDWAQILLRTPLLGVGGMVLQVLFYYPAYLVLNRDLRPTELVAARRVADREEIPIHAVDELPTASLVAAGPKLILVNWAFLVPIVALWPLESLVTAVVFLVGGLAPIAIRRRDRRRPAVALAVAAVVGCVALLVVGPVAHLLVLLGGVSFLVVIGNSVGHRNDHMLERVASISDTEGYENAVLITGKGHLGGMARRAAEFGIEVPAAHVSMWLNDGETHAPATAASLPNLNDDEEGAAYGIEVGSEHEVFRERILARVADWVDTLLIVGTLWALVFAPSGELFGVGPLSAGGVVMLGLLVFGLSPLVHAIQEIQDGTTAGKRQYGLAVASTDGSPPSKGALVVRNLLRPVDAALLCLVPVASDRNRRVGDYLAGTVVGRRRQVPLGRPTAD